MDSKLSVERCRELLGAECDGWPDSKVERWRDRVVAMAHVMLPVVKKVSRDDVESMHWQAYACRQGPMEELADDRGGEFDDLDVWPTAEGPCRVN